MNITKLDIIKSHIDDLHLLKKINKEHVILIENMICDMKALKQMEENRWNNH